MELDLIRIFVKVVQNGSFSKAADQLKLPKSTVSKSISRLENDTGTKLLMRTTRSLTLTAAGRAFYEASLGPIQTLEEAGRSLHGQDSMLSGLVRITAPDDLGNYVIAGIAAELSTKHPKLSFELHYTDEVIDLVKDGFDFAVRIGRINESRFKAKKVGDVSLILVASPKYLKGKEKIGSPKDLENFDCLTYSSSSFLSRWTLRSSKGTAHVSIHPKIASNQMTTILRSAVVDGGIAFVPGYLCKEYLDDGKLVRILPDWSSPALPVSVVSPLATASSARLKITMEYLSKAVSQALA